MFVNYILRRNQWKLACVPETWEAWTLVVSDSITVNIGCQSDSITVNIGCQSDSITVNIGCQSDSFTVNIGCQSDSITAHNTHYQKTVDLDFPGALRTNCVSKS